MKKLFLVLTLVMVLGLVGCGSSWKADTFIKNSDPFFDLKLTTSDCISYTLVVTNKTQKDAEIVWGKTYYIDETNATNGGFMFGPDGHPNSPTYGHLKIPHPTVVFLSLIHI